MNRDTEEAQQADAQLDAHRAVHARVAAHLHQVTGRGPLAGLVPELVELVARLARRGS
jgi:hypothetical protein